MAAVAVQCKAGGVDGFDAGDCVAFDAGDLHQPAHGIAGEAQVVFDAHFGGIFHLLGRSAEDLAETGSSHGAGGTHLTLAADLGT
ncbi:hypothetical protein D3C73_1558700 [compost metagenome]